MEAHRRHVMFLRTSTIQSKTHNFTSCPLSFSRYHLKDVNGLSPDAVSWSPLGLFIKQESRQKCSQCKLSPCLYWFSKGTYYVSFLLSKERFYCEDRTHIRQKYVIYYTDFTYYLRISFSKYHIELKCKIP